MIQQENSYEEETARMEQKIELLNQTLSQKKKVLDQK